VGGKGLVAANLSSLNFVDLHAIFTLLIYSHMVEKLLLQL
jgi:hypothetical protein